MDDDKNNVSKNNDSNAGGKPEGKSLKASKNNKESLSVRLTKWFNNKKNEYLSEFKRIVWPTREVLIKETVTVIVVSLAFAVYIAILDGAFGFLFSQFAQFTSGFIS